MKAIVRRGRIDASVDARIGKGCDAVTAFNRAMILDRSLSEHDRAAYAKSYNNGFVSECNAMRREGRL